MPVAIHQVLATLGYGDAIGHEVLGIQRVLRGAGYESEIFVQTADPRLEHLTLGLSRPGRRQPSRQHPDSPLLDRIARVADGLRAARSHGARLPQHHAAGVLRRRQQGAGAALLPGPPRAGALQDALRPGARRFGIQPAGARGASASRRPACSTSCPASIICAAPADYTFAGEFDDDWVNLLFVGRVIPNKRIEDVIRFFHAYKTWFNPRSRLLLVGAHSGFERYLSMLHNFIADDRREGRAPRRPRLERRAGRVLRARRRVPLRERARRASACRWSSRSTWACRCSRMRPPPCRRRWTAPACSITEQGSPARRRPDQRRRRRRSRLADRIVDGQYAALDRLEAKDFAGTLLRSCRPACSRRRAASIRRSRSTSGTRSTGPRSYDEIKALPAGGVPGAAARARDPGTGNREPNDRQPVGPGGAQRRRDRRFGPPRARDCCASWGTSPISTR